VSKWGDRHGRSIFCRNADSAQVPVHIIIESHRAPLDELHDRRGREQFRHRRNPKCRQLWRYGRRASKIGVAVAFCQSDRAVVNDDERGARHVLTRHFTFEICVRK
jgi:hypothetical protein